MNPLVSVMIGAYNAAPYLGEAIESALGQDYEPIELIVVDDGSTDGTADVARSFAQTKLIQQENGGNGAARNRAVENASGELYAFLDADDRFTPGKLRLQKGALDADPGLDMVFGHVREFFSPELDEETRASLRPPAAEPMPWTAPNLMLVRRESFQRVGSLYDRRQGRRHCRLVRTGSRSGPPLRDPSGGRARAPSTHSEQWAPRECVPLAIPPGHPAGDGAPPRRGRRRPGEGHMSDSTPRGSFWPSATRNAPFWRSHSARSSKLRHAGRHCSPST